ncbi:EF-hand domain-containing protein D1 [Xiphias gladius]|uniref:EF-hand domain-containing protein D1 n=1 Tax=Xiphias gladius TaxID=8245 RepID=UPI001A98243C|nr:EF-hand domain-containing protein D1 [Xiphias gladius]XP_039978948.1 EF-hand domain-containing protein D1 [Xiphias gladius]
MKHLSGSIPSHNLGAQRPARSMASEELARKLQSRLAATQEAEPMSEPEQSPVQPKSREHEAACGDSSSELSAKLTRRLDINEGNAASRPTRVFNPYTEFKEFSRRQIKDMEAMFRRYDTGKDGFIDLMELKLMMEKLGAPQTHVALKNMIKEVDEDFDGKLSFREFLLIFRRAAAGELQEESGLMALARLSEISVSTEGVMGAKDFFEAKMQALSLGSKFEAEIREEKEERKRQDVEKKQRQAAFKQLQSTFCS